MPQTPCAHAPHLLYRQSQWWPSLAGTILARSKLKLISFLQQCDCEIIIIIIIACHDHYHHHHYHQVMVDWSKIVKNAQCVDKFVVWMWWVSFSRFLTIVDEQLTINCLKSKNNPGQMERRELGNRPFQKRLLILFCLLLNTVMRKTGKNPRIENQS